MEIVEYTKWKTRKELPLARKLDLQFDPQLLLQAFLNYNESQTWDGLGSEYIGLCEKHGRLPPLFFKKEELESSPHICDMDWESLSYQQMPLTEWDSTYSLTNRKSRSHSAWDERIAKNDPKADERWYRKKKDALPAYLVHVLDTLGGDFVHRARFAKLKANSSVKPHIDYDTTYSIRLHIPIVTNHECFFGGTNSAGIEERYHMPADGHVWFINPGLKHWASNSGSTDRVHLIISFDSQHVLDHLEPISNQ